MKNTAVIIFLVLSNCCCIFAMQVSSDYGVISNYYNLRGRQSDASSAVFSVLRTGLACSDLPLLFHYQILQMQASKTKRTGSRKASAPARKATLQPLSKLDFPTEQLFTLLETFFGSGGASSPTKSTNFLLTQWFSTEHMPASQWNKNFVSNKV